MGGSKIFSRGGGGFQNFLQNVKIFSQNTILTKLFEKNFQKYTGQKRRFQSHFEKF